MKNIITCLLLAGSVLTAPLTLHASGSYSYSKSKPKAFDAKKYSLGQNIYVGKIKLPTANAKKAPQQKPRLQLLQKRLPKSAQKRIQLATLAGRLSDVQLASLEYYLNKRYPAKQ